MPHSLLTAQTPQRKPGLLERFGVWYYRRLQARPPQEPVGQVSDAQVCARLTRLVQGHAAVAFAIGGLSAAGSAYVSYRYYDMPDYFWEGNLVLVLVTLGLSAIEFAVLFWLALGLVYYLARVAGHDLTATDPVYAPDSFQYLMARAALEVPDPVLRYLDLDPLARVPRQRLWLVGLLYKVKVGGTSVFLRLLMVRLLGKSLLRYARYTYFIAIPVTGFWNAWTLYKVAADARLRLYGNRLAHRVAEQLRQWHTATPLSPLAQVAVFEAVGNTVVLTQNYHPNMVLLLIRLREVLPEVAHGRLDDWDRFVGHLAQLPGPEQALLRNLLVLASAFDGTFSTLERHELPDAFGAHMPLYAQRIRHLRRALRRGRFEAALPLADLAFDPTH